MNEQEIQESLPWYVNNTLTGDEKQSVETALADNGDLQQEVTFLQSLRDALQQQPAPVSSPGDLGWQRLKRQLQTATPTVKSGRGWRAFAVAASLVAVIQAGYIIQQRESAPGIVPLSGSHYEGPVLQIQFKDSATEASIRALLFRYQARMIDGPSASGVYRIAVKNGHRSIAQTVTALRQNSDIVDYVAEE